MHIAITGGAGFIGSHLHQELVRRGHRVFCLDNFSTGRRENLASFGDSPNSNVIECDVRDQAKLTEIFTQDHINLVYHCAAVVGVQRTQENPEDVLDVNIGGTLNVLRAALRSGCQKVVNISSSEVYGSPVEVPERETSPKNVGSPYAISKLAAEEYCKLYYEKHGLKTTSLRLFNVYGPRQDATPYGFVVGIFMRRVLRDQSPVIYGDGFQTRDFTYIEDTILPMIIAAESEAATGQVFNIAAGKPVTILDLAELVLEVCGKRLEPVFAPERPGEIRHRFADITKLRTVLGYKPRYELKEGLALTIDWYRKRLAETGPG